MAHVKFGPDLLKTVAMYIRNRETDRHTLTHTHTHTHVLSKTFADNASVNIVELIIADRSPSSVVIHFQTTLSLCPSHQSDRTTT